MQDRRVGQVGSAFAHQAYQAYLPTRPTCLGEHSMTIETWLACALADADKRNLPDLKPLLEELARVMQALRAADFNDRADA